ncbi:MAG TPA: response regulator transcription factor [Verrucomicrobiae bacterium]
MSQSAASQNSAATKKTPEKNRIFIVDDHAMFREGLRQLIEREPDFAVCGDVATAAEALSAIADVPPDLVIVDISLSGTSGIDLIKAIREQHEDLPVLVVSMHEETLYAQRALRAGAMGYVMKQEPGKTVKAAIRKVLGGNLHLSEAMSATMLARNMRGDQILRPASPIEALSDRELEVFRMLGQGKGVRLIAEELQLTIPTVNSFRNRIKEKLSLKSSTEVMLHAIQWLRESSTG